MPLRLISTVRKIYGLVGIDKFRSLSEENLTDQKEGQAREEEESVGHSDCIW